MNPPLTPFLDLATMKKVKRILVAVAGVTVLAVGIALVVLPGPAFLVIPAGLAILAIEFAWARRWLRSTKDFVKRSARFISGNHGNTNGVPMKEATPSISHRLPPERTVRPRAVNLGRYSVSSASEALPPVEPEALSRFEGEGGREAPTPDLVEVPLDNAIWLRPIRPHQSKRKHIQNE